MRSLFWGVRKAQSRDSAVENSRMASLLDAALSSLAVTSVEPLMWRLREGSILPMPTNADDVDKNAFAVVFNVPGFPAIAMRSGLKVSAYNVPVMLAEPFTSNARVGRMVLIPMRLLLEST